MADQGTGAVPGITGNRIRIFVDFWNFQLSVREWRSDFQFDWKYLGPTLAQEAAKEASIPNALYENLHVYLSYDPNKPGDRKLKSWATNTLDRFPGVEVVIKERKAKGPPTCPNCHKAIEDCPLCDLKMRRTVEKGIDTAIVTDMIRLAWEDAFDLAVLVSSDRDFIPAVEFLNSKGYKIINACLPPRGRDLARKCWASINLKSVLPSVER